MALAELLSDRAWVPRYSVGHRVGIEARQAGDPVDADGDVTVTMATLDDVRMIFANRVADHPELGVYEIVLSSGDTSTPSLYDLTFNYVLGGQAQVYVGYLEVADSAPTYDQLSDEGKVIVERVWLRLADLYDSQYGGPHAQVYAQTRFDRERMAQLLSAAIGRLNTISQPHQTYTIENFPWVSWGPLVETALLIEAIKHLLRIYTEQPDVQGVTTARTDRRDYVSRWRDIYDIEKADLDQQLEGFKIAHMGLGAPSLLVAGGIYKELAPTHIPSYRVARPYRWAVTVY